MNVAILERPKLVCRNLKGDFELENWCLRRFRFGDFWRFLLFRHRLHVGRATVVCNFNPLGHLQSKIIIMETL